MQSPQIESKNLMIIEDQASQEMIAAKKIDTFASQITDPQARSMANELSTHHRTHFDNLLNYLNSHQ